ncbi:polyprotein of retroviral, partial [Lasius niger]
MCFECLVNKVPGGKRQGLLHPIKPVRRPFAIIHMDHLGPFVTSSKRNKELLVVIDNLTRFVQLYPLKDTSAKNVVKTLVSFVEAFGLPERIISDRGPCFTSNELEKYCAENGIAHTLNSTAHPQGNGMVERANRTIISAIVTSMESKEHKDWDAKLKEIERSLNNTINKTIGRTPFEILHGYVPRFKDGILRVLADEEADSWNEPVELQNDAREKIAKGQEKMKQYFDKKKSSIVT